MAVELLPPDEAVHGGERWHELRRQGVTASEIAIVLGISPYGSPFSLYWQKINDWRDAGNTFTSAGRRLEDAIAGWWETEHGSPEDLIAAPAGLYAHPDRPWQLATPDRLLHAPCLGCSGVGSYRSPGMTFDFVCPDCDGSRIDGPPIALLECKWVAHSWDGWGEQGTDEIPVYYRAQGLWQLDTLGVDDVYFAALGPGGFRTYHVRRDETDLKIMREAGEAFRQQILAGDAPDLDSHSATTATLRRLFPTVGEGDVEVPLELAEGYRTARADQRAAAARVDLYEAEIRAILGDTYNRAVCNGRLVASRSVYEQSGDTAELTALEDDWPTTDRLNPGRSTSYA